MNILQVIDKLDVGGAERVCVDLSNILKENELDISILFLLEKGNLYKYLNPLIPFFELKRYNKFNPIKFYGCSKILRNYTIIHCHSRHVFRYIKLVTLIFNLKNKIILHDHFGLIEIDHSVPLLLNNILKPNIFIGVSSKLNAWAEVNLKIKKENIFLLENIITKQNLNNSLQIKYDFILVSNIKPSKNQKFAMSLSQIFNDKSFLMVGNIQDKDYFKTLKNNYQGNNIFFNTTAENVQSILMTARIGLHVSPSETGPLVLIEYLAQGVPFLSFETGEVAKILKPYFPDFFINNFDLDQWRLKIEKILQMPDQKSKMTEVFEKHFSSKDYFNKCKEIYTTISN